MPATPAWPPRSAPRLFVEQRLEEDGQIEVGGNQAHYLAKVMRVSAGDIVILCDDKTGEWAARVQEAAKRSVQLSVTEQLRPREEVPDFWLCPALLKKDRFDFVLEKATELGVRRIAPIVTRRCVANKLNTDRARTLVMEAAEQCARTALPELSGVQKFSALMASWPSDRTLFFADETGGQDAASVFSETVGPAALITGPEGGFDDEERKILLAHPKVKPISLGPRILRGETAAIAAVSLWMGISGDWPNGGSNAL
ncbi:16S rRNA (uracil(1498)-N(3))-methyltransferase [Pontixanthobacter aestiaquae]|uniref:Ribosomal RNA small subunit methyltransferase E n=1 Tax=Pontixanthobacter aestiaquae TaxID=1509367 RepID=A0A844Z8D2_9SPHN|nr:16S rRNA (uracil(1498)-N(3))-methyltransferase [Pontixanthobacter aestiaquae]MDN3645802.1 16S rRNA (uracil(1498)-N(3))-methyltransferase [Pontixanthobacter aestiaquae]MXO83203.1 16S rRNA (uracil(1498)-N(3))-methyltransferase [Pontixanthobacter aestiaquae]